MALLSSGSGLGAMIEHNAPRARRLYVRASPRYRAVVSEVVATELEPAPDGVKAKWDEILGLKPEFLEVTEEVTAVATEYVERAALPLKFYNDLLHIALATVADVDVLVSWNFKHIVRLEKIRVFNGVNLELGYKQLQIYSPREVTSYGS